MTMCKRESRGFSLLELVIIAGVVIAIGGYAVARFLSTQADIACSNAAQSLAAYIEQARMDSNRRHATKVEEMASVEVVDSKSYVVIVDEDADGVLDPPLNVTLPAGDNLQIKGPFPKTFRFDWSGRVVDAQDQVNPAPLVTFVNRKGTSTLRLSQTGKPVILAGTQAGIGIWK
jgi:type II secretory pathway pseudopilin PulG